MRIRLSQFALAAMLAGTGISVSPDRARAEISDLAIVKDCLDLLRRGPRKIAEVRTERFLGKVSEAAAGCRGGEKALKYRGVPWVDWSNYWGAADADSKADQDDRIKVPPLLQHLLKRDTRGVDGALMDLEYQRMELIKFNLFDNLTYEQYVKGAKVNGRQEDGSILKVWKEMRLAAGDPNVTTDPKTGDQICKPSAIRFRTMTGICNDIRNPAMGSTGMLFARNVQFESTYPDLGLDQVARNRHGGRISLLKPDPAVISRRLFTRDQTGMPNCNNGKGTPDGAGDCAYQKAPFFNVIAAYWIQFMTHDWFTHMKDARNDTARTISPNMGCRFELKDGAEQPISAARAAELGCRPEDKMEAGLIADSTPGGTFTFDNKTYMKRAPKTTRNFNTAWWDASQIYGYDDNSRRRMRVDPKDPAKLELVPAHTGTAGDAFGYLPAFRSPCGAGASSGCDPINREWEGQEAVAFPDNWSIGLSFLHTVFVREHNIFVDEFRKAAKAAPDQDSGLRNPDKPTAVITNKQVSDTELFEIARLVVAAEIAKIHTIEWTTQLLYDEPLYAGMNANWSGLLKDDPLASNASKLASEATARIVGKLANSKDPKLANQFFSALAAGPGIVGTGSDGTYPSDRNPYPAGLNDGVNHFGSPFNFPEEFMSVYRLHPLVPDMIEFRELANANAIKTRIPVIDTFRAKATAKMREGGLANWAVSMGRQRLGLLLLRNHPQFLQNLDIRPRFDTTLDVPALDIIRDREHGVPRFNEFRRQIGLRQLTSFDDFIDKRLDLNKPEGQQTLKYQQDLVDRLREVYGQHVCDSSKKPITNAQLMPDGSVIDDCLGKPNGTKVDNIEDVDIVAGFLAETTRPHGYAISETQFHIFIINASRRLYSDRFFTSSFRPEFYSTFGHDWVVNNGPTWETAEGSPNGHEEYVLPMKRVLLRTMPELKDELKEVVNAFDPWARDRKGKGNYYSVEWEPREDAKGKDPAFPK